MILTVTLNPALDRLLFVDGLQWHEKNIVRETHTFTSVKGFNVAKALAALAIETTALGFVGRADSDSYTRRFEQRHARLSLVSIATTRTNIKIIGPTEIKKPKSTNAAQRSFRMNLNNCVTRTANLFPAQNS